MYLGNLVQSIDSGIATLESFLEIHPQTHVLIPRLMKLDPRLGKGFCKSKTCHRVDLMGRFRRSGRFLLVVLAIETSFQFLVKIQPTGRT